MKSASIVASVSLCLFVSSGIHAGQYSRTSDLKDRVNALEVQVESNTNDIAANSAAIAAISAPATYDYHDYLGASNIATKTFNLSGSFCGSANREVRSYSRTQIGSNTEVLMTRKWDDAATNIICHWRDFRYLNTPGERLMIDSSIYDTAGNLLSTYSFDQPVVLGTSTMSQGALAATSAMVYDTPVNGTSVTYGMFLESHAVTAIEDVTVPAGTFNGCIKEHSTRRSNGFGAYQRVAWYCPGVGDVKIMQMSVDGATTRIWELSNITYAP